MQFVGKTVEEALLKAEAELNKPRTAFKYDVVEEKRGFLKTIKEFVVNINGFNEPGKIGIKNGKLVYEKGEILPSIVPGENVLILVNGAYANNEVFIKEDDAVEFETIDNEGDRKIEISVSDDKMEAYISISYVSAKKYRVLDCEPSERLVVEAELEKEELPEKLTKSDVEEKLTQKRIVHGIKWETIGKAINGGVYLIAQGTKYLEAVDDKITYRFKTEKGNDLVEVDGKVNYHSINVTEFVKKGDVLAVLEEGMEGRAGFDVYGGTIAPKKKAVCRLVAGPGAELSGDSKSVTAVLDGMPTLKGNSNAVCVNSVYATGSDVDMKVGDINFDGDVLIKGSVKEGFKIRAGNAITVMGDVAEASLVAGGNITVERNVISSNLKAGEKQINEGRALDFLRAAVNLNNNLIDAYNELKNGNKLYPNTNLALVFKVLLESKYKSIKEKISEEKKFITEAAYDQELKNHCMQFLSIFNSIENSTLKEVNVLINNYRFLFNYIEKKEISLTPADVTISYAQNATIYASNDVNVRGKGCYNTNIIAENKAVFSGQPGVFRGGQIFAAKGLSMQEVGSSAGVPTVLKTTKSGVIEAKVVYQNTIIMIDEYVTKIDMPSKMLKAYVSKGELTVEKLKL